MYKHSLLALKVCETCHFKKGKAEVGVQNNGKFCVLFIFFKIIKSLREFPWK